LTPFLPFESDDRTSEAIQNKVVTAAEMKSVFGSKKPNCVIIDEIDGLWSGSGTVNFLALLDCSFLLANKSVAQ